MARLYHVTGHIPFRELEVGDIVVLVPGKQNAEGLGIYFSEGRERVTAAEGTSQEGPQAVFVIEVEGQFGDWWRTKSGKARRHHRPRTWHTKGKSIRMQVQEVALRDGLKSLKCEWEWT